MSEEIKVNLDECYLGNVKLKRAGVPQNMNVFQLQEYVKCVSDPIYFIKNYVKIISLDDGLINFFLYEYQERMIREMHDSRFSIFMLPRQFGKTTTVAGYLLHQVIFRTTCIIGILANKGDQAREIMGRIKLMYEELPWFLQPGVKKWNEGSIDLGNKSKAFTSATGGSAVRGKSLSIVYLDEFAHIENDEAFYQSTYPVITSGKTTKVIITSTPNGMNLFYKLWTDAVAKKNNYTPIQIHWNDHPDRDEDWLEEQKRNMPPRQIAQEIMCVFHGSSDTLISGSKLQRLVHTDPINHDEANRWMVYESPKPNHSYVAVADTSEGVGRDFSVVSVIDVTQQPYRHVAKYRSNIIPPLMFAGVVVDIATKYNEALLIVESNNSSGGIVCTQVWEDYEYENMLVTKVKDAENTVSSSGKSTPGVRTTARSKNIGCSNLKALIEGDTLITNDFETISEMSTFSAKGKSYEASKGKFDDCVMTLVLFAWFANEPYFAEMVDLNVKAIVRDNLAMQEDYQMLGAFMMDGTEDEIL